MSSNNILNKILNLLAVDKNELVELTRNVVYGSLFPDNEILEVSEWKMGVPVFLISEDGSKKPLKDFRNSTSLLSASHLLRSEAVSESGSLAIQSKISNRNCSSITVVLKPLQAIRPYVLRQLFQLP